MSSDYTSVLGWASVAGSFRVLPASRLLDMTHMVRHQTILQESPWLDETQPPIALLFISHRWETLDHPDPEGRQLRAVQQFIRLVCISVEAMVTNHSERLALVPSLYKEGALQAAEIARRILGFGPFSESTASVGGKTARSEIVSQWSDYGGGELFRRWLAQRIGIWLDYSCMYQKPFAGEEEREFRHAMASLGDLVRSSQVVSLRYAEDDYTHRGWCAAEYFLGSSQSFARGIYFDLDRLMNRDSISMSPVPEGQGMGSQVLADGYRLDREDFEKACRMWTECDLPLVDVSPLDAWSPYRGMWGNSSYTPDQDPNPFRQVLNAVSSLETSLIQRWLMSSEPLVIDLATECAQCLQANSLKSADQQDLSYLGVLAMHHGWIEAFRDLFASVLEHYAGWNSEQGEWRCRVRLEALESDQRQLFTQLQPASAPSWRLRLATRSGTGDEEAMVINALRESLRDSPPKFRIL